MPLKEEFRKYGKPPYQILTLHGGPGAPGIMAPMAEGISDYLGVLEPFQTGQSIAEQVHELYEFIIEHALIPVTLVGHSWGAWLAWIFTARHPILVDKIVLIGTPAFEENFNANLMETRKSRLTQTEWDEYALFLKQMEEKSLFTGTGLNRFEKLLIKADSFDCKEEKNELLDFQSDIYDSIWKEAEEYRKTGLLLRLGKTIDCHIAVIHGLEDPHSFSGVKEPLLKINPSVKFYPVEKCGHYPWYEKQASETFFNILKEELTKIVI